MKGKERCHLQHTGGRRRKRISGNAVWERETERKGKKRPAFLPQSEGGKETIRPLLPILEQLGEKEESPRKKEKWAEGQASSGIETLEEGEIQARKGTRGEREKKKKDGSFDPAEPIKRKKRNPSSVLFVRGKPEVRGKGGEKGESVLYPTTKEGEKKKGGRDASPSCFCEWVKEGEGGKGKENQNFISVYKGGLEQNYLSKKRKRIEGSFNHLKPEKKGGRGGSIHFWPNENKRGES